jgi:hypothetical protein
MNKLLKIGIPGTCQIVSGVEGHFMFNLEKNKYTQLPDAIFEIFKKYSHLTIEQIEQLYDDHKGKISTFLATLKQAEFIFETQFPEHYSSANLDWNRPEKIFNAIVAYHKNSNYSLIDTLKQLDDLGTKYLEIRLSGNLEYSFVENVLRKIRTSRLVMIDIVMEDMIVSHSDFERIINKLLADFPKINRVLIYGVPHHKIASLPDITNVFYTTKSLVSIEENNLSKNYNKYFINTEFFKESQKYNPFYNRKVCISEKGLIKNCLSLSQSFGLVDMDTIEDVISKSDFQQLWNWNNDKDEKLKHSAFRYVVLNSAC